MTRNLTALALLVTFAAPAAAQDMPLSQILIDGEGWRKAEKAERPRRVDRLAVMGLNSTAPERRLSAAVRAPSGGTIFVGHDEGRDLWAYPADGKGITGSGAAYAPLRTRRGEKTIEVTGLATDKDGRIYAATPLGVQVFDPTGRLCGVMTPAAPGKAEFMAFEGDRLTLWIGETKYTRKLNTSGAK